MIIIRKIPLQSLLSLLNDIYEGGADFIDIHGERIENAFQDKITIAVPIDYMSPASNIENGGPPPPGVEEEEEEILTEEQLNDLLDNV